MTKSTRESPPRVAAPLTKEAAKARAARAVVVAVVAEKAAKVVEATRVVAEANTGAPRGLTTLWLVCPLAV